MRTERLVDRVTIEPYTTDYSEAYLHDFHVYASLFDSTDCHWQYLLTLDVDTDTARVDSHLVSDRDPAVDYRDGRRLSWDIPHSPTLEGLHSVLADRTLHDALEQALASATPYSDHDGPLHSNATDTAVRRVGTVLDELCSHVGQVRVISVSDAYPSREDLEFSIQQHDVSVPSAASSNDELERVADALEFDTAQVAAESPDDRVIIPDASDYLLELCIGYQREQERNTLIDLVQQRDALNARIWEMAREQRNWPDTVAHAGGQLNSLRSLADVLGFRSPQTVLNWLNSE